MAPSLVIMLPTYGRTRQTETLLRRFAAEPEVASGQVEIFVSDDRSPDDTVENIELVRAEMPNLNMRVHVQSENVGPVPNGRWMFENSDADYVWMLGNDDLPVPGALGAVLRHLTEVQPEFLHLPHRFAHGAESPCPDHFEIFPSGREILLAYHHWLSFTSSGVVRLEPLLQAIADAPTQNQWASHIWYPLAGRNGICAVADRRLLLGSTAPATWQSRKQQLYTTGLINAFDDGFNLLVDEPRVRAPA